MKFFKTKPALPTNVTDVFKEELAETTMTFGPLLYTPSMDEKRNINFYQNLAENSLKVNNTRLLELLETVKSVPDVANAYSTGIIDLLVDFNINSGIKLKKLETGKIQLDGLVNTESHSVTIKVLVSSTLSDIKKAELLSSVEVVADKNPFLFTTEVELQPSESAMFLFLDISVASKTHSEYESNRQITVMSLNPDLSTLFLFQKLFMGDIELFMNDIYGVENGVDGEEDDCVICMADKRSSIVLPCKHLCVCSDCGGLLVSEKQKCPMCRQVIYSILNLEK